MQKVKKLLLTILMGISVLLFSPETVQAAGNCVDFTGSNVEAQNYSRWSSAVKSYLTSTSNGRLMLVQAGEGIDGVAVSYYTNTYEYQGNRIIPKELPIFGGFYETENNYYLLTGQNNESQDSKVEVYRITKYDKAWNRISGVGLYDCNTVAPFDAGSARMTHQGKYLLIR